MAARIPLDVDLEDKLLYGLTPIRLAYLLVALVAGFGMWSAHWGHVVVRGCAAGIVIGAGVIAAWGRWRGRATDDWAIDIAVFVLSNHRLSWRRRWPRSVGRSLSASIEGTVSRAGHRDRHRAAFRGRMIPALDLGLVRLAPRGPGVLWNGACDADVVAIATGAVGFAAAAEEDRARWVNSFRHLLDGLDAPLQVVIDVEPGRETNSGDDDLLPVDFDEMRGADLCFVERIARSPASHRFRTRFVTETRQAARIQAALQEMGIRFEASPAEHVAVFGRELADHLVHTGGFSRTWYIERLPGTELEPGWLYRMLPPGLRLSLAWHVTPLPIAWIVGYLQRQLVNMRASRLVEQSAGAADPTLAGALPNAEDLQRRLAASQDKAFHVAVYLTLTAPTHLELDGGAQKIEASSRAILCDLQPCTFRMRDAYVATSAAGI